MKKNGAQQGGLHGPQNGMVYQILYLIRVVHLAKQVRNAHGNFEIKAQLKC